MNASDPPFEAPWFTPTQVMRLAGGEVLLKPGKPVQRATGKQTEKWTGVPLQTLRRLAETGFITRACVTKVKHLYYPAEVEAFIAKTEADPDFWDEVKVKAYLAGRCRKNPPQPPEENAQRVAPADEKTLITKSDVYEPID